MPIMPEITDSGRCAIMTKFLGPTNTRPSRIKAWAESGTKLTVTLPWDHALRASQNHAAAAVALCDKMGWTFTTLHQAYLNNGCVFVMEG